MFDEGIYDLSYAANDANGRDEGSGIVLLREGRILGCDRSGGLFTGNYDFDGTHQVHLHLVVPPGGMLVTGFCAGPEGARLDIVCQFDRAASEASTVVTLHGAPVEVRLAYIGPLPSASGGRPARNDRRRCSCQSLA
jgi:hypothetical protein